MNYKYIELTDKEHDDFVKSHKYGEINQLSSWAKVKSSWECKRIALEKDGKVNSVAQLLFKKIPYTPFKLCYIARGPVCDYNNKDDIKAILDEITKLAKKEKCFSVKLDPMVSIEKKDVIDFLKNNNCFHHGLEKGMVYNQPRFTMITPIDVDENTLLKSFQSKTQNAVKKSLKNGLVCERCSIDELESFSTLMKITGSRNEFNTRNNAYFKKLLDELKDDAELYLTKLIPEKVIISCQNELNEIIKLKTKTENKLNKEKDENKKQNLSSELEILDNRYKRSNELINDMNDLINKGVSNIILSGAILTFCGNKAYYLYGASSNDYRDLNPNYLMIWVLMKRAKERNCTTFDFGGVSGFVDGENENDHEKGLYVFKKKWGTYMFETIGEFDIIINKFIFKSFEAALKLRKKLR